MNKADLIQALSGRLGDRKSATEALDTVLSEIQNAVSKGDKVSITGFGVFEKRTRAARTARNPRTGEPVRVARTAVPAFRPGTGFKDQVASGRVVRATKSTAPGRTTAKAPGRTTAKKAGATATKRSPAKKAAPSRTAPARKTTARTSSTRTSSGRTTSSRTSSARKAPARTASRSRARSSR